MTHLTSSRKPLEGVEGRGGGERTTEWGNEALLSVEVAAWRAAKKHLSE